MRIDASFNNSVNYQAPAPQAQQAAIRDIRVSFEPITQADMSPRGMLLYMQRQLGVGGQVDQLA